MDFFGRYLLNLRNKTKSKFLFFGILNFLITQIILGLHFYFCLFILLLLLVKLQMLVLDILYIQELYSILKKNIHQRISSYTHLMQFLFG
mgnify:CR=1 FL=1